MVAEPSHYVEFVQLKLPLDSHILEGSLEHVTFGRNVEYTLSHILWMTRQTWDGKGTVKFTFVRGKVTEFAKIVEG